MASIHDFSGLGRTLDSGYPYHQIVVGLAVLAGVVHGLITLFTVGFFAAVGAGVMAGISVATAWALARELDPAGERWALIGAALAVIFPGAWRFLPAMILVIMLARIVNRVTGVPLQWFDTIVVLGLVGLVAVWDSWSLALVAAAAFLLDGLLVKPNQRHLGVALIPLVFAAFSIGGTPDPAFQPTGGFVPLVVAGMLLLYVWTIMTMREVKAEADAGGPIYLERVQAGGTIAVVAGLLLLIFAGAPGVTGLAPLWVAFIGPAARGALSHN